MGTDAAGSAEAFSSGTVASPTRTLRRIGNLASGLTAALGALTLIGWATGNLLLASVRSDFIPMAPNTAAAFLLLAVTLLVPSRPMLQRVVALTTTGIAVHALMTGQHMGAQGSLGPFPLGVMSPVTATAFLLAGASFFASTTVRFRPLAAPAASTTAAVGVVSVLGYAYGSPLLYQGSVIPLALTTGICFLALGTALLVRLGPAVWPVQVFVGDAVRARMTRVFVPTVMVVTLVQGWLGILIAHGPVRNPAIFAAALAALSVPLTAFVISKISKRIGREIEQAETRRLRAEENRARLEEQKRAAAALAQQKEDLARLVVHDLKNPLATIVLGVELLRMKVREDEQSDRLAGDVLSAAMTMDRMALDLLDISRSEDGALTPRLQSVDLNDLLSRVIRSMRLRTDQHEATVSLSSTLSSPQIEADPQLLQRVVENLLDNSLKYAPKGHAIHALLEDCDDDAVELIVLDEGPGVPPACRERIFEKYARLDRDSASGARESRGLGLAFCKLAVEAHGGRIWVEENHPVGSRFRVRLPRRQGVGTKARKSGRAAIEKAVAR